MWENIYAIVDTKAGIALKPLMCDKNDVQPIRILQNTVESADSQIAKYPKEFQLVHVGQINLETLEVEAQEPPRLVAIAVDLLPKEPQQ